MKIKKIDILALRELTLICLDYQELVKGLELFHIL